jgi:hypothetical protein
MQVPDVSIGLSLASEFGIQSIVGIDGVFCYSKEAISRDD